MFHLRLEALLENGPLLVLSSRWPSFFTRPAMRSYSVRFTKFCEKNMR